MAKSLRRNGTAWGVLASRVATFYAPGMFRAPRKLDSEPELYETAVRALMRRAHSVHEMKKSLERRSDDKAMVKSVIERLKRQGMIDDARYAKQFTRQRAEIRKQGKFRIARELRARGIPDQHIDSGSRRIRERNRRARRGASAHREKTEIISRRNR